jgi:hypothetical protein
MNFADASRGLAAAAARLAACPENGAYPQGTCDKVLAAIERFQTVN